jgi:hypothetical protein
VPIAALANTSIAFVRCFLNEFENFSSGGARAKNRFDAGFMKCSPILVGDDAASKDNDIVQSSLDQFLAHLWEQVSVSTGQRGEAEEASVFIPDGVNDLL